ncbi:MAG: SWIB/MDM2 domain-containing protein [Saprospiraceae bacterium]
MATKPVKKAAPKKAAAKKAAPKKAVKKVVAKAKAKPAAKKAAPKPAAKKAAPKKAAAKKKSARKPSAAFMKPLNLSADLGAVVGAKPIPRTEVVKKLWVYIKANKLQDAKNKRMINADAKLKPIFGGKAQVSMFDMAKLISKHVS